MAAAAGFGIDLGGHSIVEPCASTDWCSVWARFDSNSRVYVTVLCLRISFSRSVLKLDV